jgi:hypothetical protein
LFFVLGFTALSTNGRLLHNCDYVQEFPRTWLGSLLTFDKPFRLAEDDNSTPRLLSGMGRTAILLREHM